MNSAVLSKLVALSLLVLCGNALAAPRDKAALKKIDEAINTHYLTTDFAKAESVLLGTIQACGEKCSANVLARAWMYVGIVRGSGKDDMNGALEAFRNAIGHDPTITLDEALATPATRDVFSKAKAQGGTTPAAPTGGEDVAAGPDEDGGGTPMSTTFQCTPIQREIETRRPIPFSCTTTQSATSGMLFFQEYGSDEWKSTQLQMRKGSLQGMIPCEATSLVGRLEVYVEARDAQGNVVDSLGSRGSPIGFNVVNSTNQQPPAFPGMDPPDRCEDAGECPPDFPGCKSGKSGKKWGDSCEEDSECESNYCSSGSCESCTADEECPSGSCVDGACTGGGDEGGRSEAGPYKKFWIGVHGAYDIGVVSGDDVCNPGADGWSCYYAGGEQEYGPYWPYQYWGNDVAVGAAPGTARVLLSLEYAPARRVSLGVRVGYAFLGGPSDFLPVHAEARGTFWLRSLDKRGVRPYVHLGAGLGQVDVKAETNILDCMTAAGSPVQPNQLSGVTDYQAQQCGAGYLVTDPANTANPNGAPGPAVPMDVYRHMGTMFAAPGAGLMFAFTQNVGLQLNVDAKVLFPTLGFAVSPSLGLVVGL